jgi:amino acid transporter
LSINYLAYIYDKRFVRHNREEMKKPPTTQAGFIPMMLCIIAVIVGIIYFVYTRVVAAGY